jgi:hypothetical protein
LRRRLAGCLALAFRPASNQPDDSGSKHKSVSEKYERLRAAAFCPQPRRRGPRGSKPQRCSWKWGARPSRSLPAGVPPAGLGLTIAHFLVKQSGGADAFGGTPKAAGVDARAPQSICIATAKPAFHVRAYPLGFWRHYQWRSEGSSANEPLPGHCARFNKFTRA